MAWQPATRTGWSVRADRDDLVMRQAEVLPFSDEDGANAYFGPQVGRHVAALRRALICAERRLHSLGDLTDDADSAVWHVEMELAEFLTWARQVRVSITAAVKAADDPRANTWWDGLADDLELSAFTERRNRALKRVETACELRRITMDIDGVPHFATYFMFSDDPYAGDPVYPRCQKHLARIREIALETQGLLPAATQ